MTTEVDRGVSHAATVLAIHTIPGRVRCRVRGLRQNPRAEHQLVHALQGYVGIVRVHASSITGTVLVEFDSSLTSDAIPEILEAAIQGRIKPAARTAEQAEAGKPAPSRLRTWMQRLLRTGPPPAHHPADIALNAQPWHALEKSRTTQILNVGPRGLSNEEAAARVTRFGANVLPAARPRSGLTLFLDQLISIPVLLLLGSSVISVLTGGLVDAAVIFSVVVLNATMGALTEKHAQKTISTLTDLEEPEAWVMREGRVERISAARVALGDLILLSRGNYIPADGRLLETRDLTVAESALTGESAPIRKHTHPLGRQLALADRSNMVFRGTVVTGGSGIAVVVAIGPLTELGAVHALMQGTIRPETAMERQLNQLGKQTAIAALVVCAITLALGALRGFGLLETLRSAVSLAVAALPEGLPTMATIALAFGMLRMRRHHVLARNLSAVETIGLIDMLCLDKTGTLTTNSMAVVEVYAAGERIVFDVRRTLIRTAEDTQVPHLHMLLAVCALCSEAEIAGNAERESFSGSATEVALLELVRDSHLRVGELRKRFPLLELRSRAEDRNFMLTVHAASRDRHLVAAKGSPEEMFARCSRRADASGVHPLTSSDKKRILHENARLASEGRRVLGFAYLETPAAETAPETGWTWIGLVALADPPRKGVKAALREIRNAGIQTRMVTGDQRRTAYAIGREIGLWDESETAEVWDAGSSNGTSRLDEHVLHSHVFSRVSPSHKLDIVQVLQRAGHIVAMTGDGINDGPALKASDVGVALGSGSTETARESADLILGTDDLSALLCAIREGRAVHRNIRQAVRFLITTNLSEVLSVLGAVAVGIGQPLTARQLLWLNLVTDIFPVLALAVEPDRPGPMDATPPDSRHALLSRKELPKLVGQSVLMAAAVAGSYLYGIRRYGSGSRASTMAFLSLTTAQLLHTLTMRQQPGSPSSLLAAPANKYIPLAVGGGLILELFTMLPPLRSLLGLASISLADLGVCLASIGISSLGTLLMHLFWKVPPERTLAAMATPVASRQLALSA